MKVTAIVPAFNAERFLKRAVDSLFSTGHEDLRVLVIDDGSDDKTYELAKALESQFRPHLEAHQHPSGMNRGVSASRNLGLAKCSDGLVCFLDADDYVLPHRFEKALSVLDAQPKVHGVYDATLVRLERSAADANSGLGGSEGDGTHFGLATAHTGSDLVRQLLTGVPWHPNAFLCRRSMFDTTGVFDESMRIAEDCHLWFRAAALCNIVPGDLEHPVAAYVRHDQNTFTYSIERKLDMVRAMVDAYQCISKSASAEIVQVFRQGVIDYVEQSLITAREANKPEIAWGIARTCAANGSGALLMRDRLVRQIVWLARETLFGRRR